MDFGEYICSRRFQYISCYCLSQNSQKVLRLLENFYTSHVTVYHYCEILSIFVITFQYISCYCLSVRIQLGQFTIYISIHLMLLFIRFCNVGGKNGRKISIHLMLLFIAVGIFPMLLIVLISIHLMLLFIEYEQIFKVLKNRFQYISCYCLSSHITKQE